MNRGTKFRTEPAAARASTKENLGSPATGFAGLAKLSEAAPDGIKIIRFRPANIRLINRRLNLPGCCLPCLRQTEKQRTTTKQPHSLTGIDRSLHISDLSCTHKALTAVDRFHEEEVTMPTMVRAGRTFFAIRHDRARRLGVVYADSSWSGRAHRTFSRVEGMVLSPRHRAIGSRSRIVLGEDCPSAALVLA